MNLHQIFSLRSLTLLVSMQMLSSALTAQDITLTLTPTCAGANEGSIEATLVTEDYAPPFTFTWTDEAGNPIPPGQIIQDPVEGTSTVSGLDAGEYCVVVTSADGCNASGCGLVVEELAGPVINSITPICICPNNGYGGAEYEVLGGSGDYNYLWELVGEQWPLTYNEANPQFVNLLPLAELPDVYNLTITDLVTGCEATASLQIDMCTGFDLAPFIEITPDCNEEGTSTLNVQLPPGMGLVPFEFRWSKVGFGLVKFDPSQDGFSSLENAGPGEYCLNLRTFNGCDETVCGIIVESQPSPEIIYMVTPSNSGDGAIAIDMTGQQGAFSYQWATGQTTATISNLESGEYFVTVTNDANGCKSTAQINVVGCDDIEHSITPMDAQVTPISSSGSFGAINILNVSDQFPGYDFTFNWSNGEIVEDIYGLISGAYTLIVSSGDCNFSVHDSWEVCGFSVGFEVYPYLNSCDLGELYVNISPDDNYSILWDDPAQSTTETIPAEYGVEYCVTISIGFAPNVCQATACITPEPPPIKIELVNLEHASYGFPTGVVQVDANVGPYSGLYELTYIWSNGGGGPIIENLYPGEYTVTVTDDCGNSATATYSIQCELLASTIGVAVTNASCSSNTGGSIEITGLPFVVTQNPEFSFQWSNGENTQIISNLAAGEYCVTIVEANTGCLTFDCFEVEADGPGTFAISFDVQPGCYPLSMGQITANANPVLGPFEYSWTTYDWGTGQMINLGHSATISDIPSGWYTVFMTNALGCTAFNYTLMWPSPPSFIVAAEPDPVVICEGETGTTQIEVTFGSPGPLTYTWANSSHHPTTYINTGGQSFLGGLEPGNWAVTVTDIKGCQAFTHFKVEESVIRVDNNIDLACGKGSIELTPFLSQWLPIYPPFTYLWSDGSSDQNRYDLEEGNYCVTITDGIGCTFSDCYGVGDPSGTALLLNSVVEDNGCGTQCSGSIELEINPSIPVTIEWADGYFYNPKKRSLLCSGEYTVTITSNENGCTEVEDFIVGQAGQDPFEYEVEVIRYFGNVISNTNGSARVKIVSDQIAQWFTGAIKIFDADPMSFPPPIVETNSFHGYAFANIPAGYSSVDPFYFTYTAPNDCVYEGEFPGIPTCSENDNFNFVVNYNGDPETYCGPNQQHEYTLGNINIGNNFPYFIKVTMVDAYDLLEGEYEQLIEVNNTISSINIYGIPAGTVKFQTYNLCDDQIFSREHDNCCRGLSCDLISASSTPQYEDSYRQNFPYFKLWTKKECFDDNCPLWDTCSEVWIDENSNALEPNCWEGTVTVTFEDGSYGKFEVKETNHVYYDDINWLEGTDVWDPPSPGTYIVDINYEGYGTNENCHIEAEVNFYGPDNFNDAILFLKEYPMPNHGPFENIPGEYRDAYYAAMPCGTCHTENDSYYFDESGGVDDCKETGNDQIQYFKFVPNNYYADDPCQSGGTLTILEFNADGELTVFTDKEIPMNVALSSFPGVWPLGLSEGMACYPEGMGWCLFDANLGSDPIYEVFFDQPILATYGDCVQYSNDDDGVSCLLEGCPADYECDPVTGMCIPLCDEDYDCPLGQECNEEEGLCVPEDNCGCWPGYKCEDGECYLNEDICKFDVYINETVGEHIFPFYHDDVPPTTTYTYRLYYKTFSIPDKIDVYHDNDLLESTGCVSTGEWEWVEFQVTGGGDIIVRVTTMECLGGNSNSKYTFEIECIEEPELLGPPTKNLVCDGILHPNDVIIDPNPFSSEIKIRSEFNDYFKGEIRLYDLMGTQVLEQDYELEPGFADFTISGLGNLPPSIYFLTITKNGELCKEKKLVKMD